jgi:hypothetical protein
LDEFASQLFGTLRGVVRYNTSLLGVSAGYGAMSLFAVNRPERVVIVLKFQKLSKLANKASIKAFI